MPRKPKVPAPKYKHAAAFSLTYTHRGQNWKALLICGRRLTIREQFTNVVGDEFDCPDCKERIERPNNGLAKRPHPMLMGKQVYVFTVE